MQRRYIKIVSVIGLILLGFFLLYRFAVAFAPGSYPYAEKYELNAPEENVVTAIKLFKTAHPELSVPKVQDQYQQQFDLIDGRKHSSDLWYHVYFYYPKENQIIFTWIRSDTKQKTTFAFVALNKGLTLFNNNKVNKDFSSRENKNIKKQFEERILDSIRQRLTHTH